MLLGDCTKKRNFSQGSRFAIPISIYHKYIETVLLEFLTCLKGLPQAQVGLYVLLTYKAKPYRKRSLYMDENEYLDAVFEESIYSDENYEPNYGHVAGSAI